MPRGQKLNVEPGPPSSHTRSKAYLHVFVQTSALVKPTITARKPPLIDNRPITSSKFRPKDRSQRQVKTSHSHPQKRKSLLNLGPVGLIQPGS